jgi:hypothetical protein
LERAESILRRTKVLVSKHKLRQVEGIERFHCEIHF